MPRPATGNAVRHDDSWFARIAVARGKRKAVRLEICGPDDEALANERAALMADVVAELRRAGRDDFIPTTLRKLATLSGKKLAQFVTLARGYAAGIEVITRQIAPGQTSFRNFAERWTSGDLAREFPGRLKEKKTARSDISRLETWVYPMLEAVPLAEVSLDHYDALLKSVTGSQATRRHVGQVIRRVLQLAVYPARLIPASPIPRGALPLKGTPKAFPYLYPSEDRALLGCTKVPLARRVLYGFLDREGTRVEEASVLRWQQFDLERGTVSIEDNKTDDFRTRPLDTGVVRALIAWKKKQRVAKPTSFVFVDDDGERLNVGRLATHLRSDLTLVGVDRRELFTESDKRGHMRAHDLRATFVTISLAGGKSETWVSDRTGHHSSAQIANYRRAARTAAELGHTALDPLDEAIPELRHGKAASEKRWHRQVAQRLAELAAESRAHGDGAVATIVERALREVGDARGDAAQAKRRRRARAATRASV